MYKQKRLNQMFQNKMLMKLFHSMNTASFIQVMLNLLLKINKQPSYFFRKVNSIWHKENHMLKNAKHVGDQTISLPVLHPSLNLLHVGKYFKSPATKHFT